MYYLPLTDPGTLMFLSIDIGTTSTKCFIYNEKELISSAQVQTSLITPHNGWVEQNPEELFDSVIQCLNQLQNELDSANVSFPTTCGITNQRESIVAFRKSTSEPLCNAINWMDVRTVDIVNAYKADEIIMSRFENSTGLKASTFFSAFKIKWLLENVQNVKKAAESHDLAVCTIDSWILWKLTNGTSYYTDPSNASRTFLYNLNTGNWCPELMDNFNIDATWLPEIKHFGNIYGQITERFPFSGCKITALIGDQQASLIGHWGKDFLGKVKCTFGTGAFLLRSIETKTCPLDNPGALRTVLLNDKFAEEFPIVCAGSLIKWLRNSLNFFQANEDFNQTDFNPKPYDESVYFIPNLSGCLFPSWNPSLRGSFHNLSLQCDKQDMIVAVFESVAFCIRRALENIHVPVLSVDGGMCTNHRFCQLLADVCNYDIRIFGNSDATGLGAAILASNFTMNIEIKSEIISPQKDLVLIYTQKYNRWCSLQN